ncbi:MULTISPECIES: hypothetical protein [Amycolatopsis]|uniref:Uncharacterized protein n=1 Tax=Amycolatopsis echigonensis TaxID=2576905 RepID=A0A8E2B7V3_9PSEU|nr:hypothetical protein [Amycolatopsis echigonensis]MBB2503657.1 hypothetical protein [Amycolatopsis echigonensis]
MTDTRHDGAAPTDAARTEVARTDGTRIDGSRIGGALADARRRLADAATALRTGSPGAAEVSAVITGTHEIATTLADLVQTLMDHTATLAKQHGPQVSNEIHADLRALHGCLTTGALLLAPALDDLAGTGTNRDGTTPRREESR